MQATKAVEEENVKRALTVLEDAKMPVSIGYVAYNIKVTWQTARSLLLKMSLIGKIAAIETTKGYLFSLKTVSQN
jgi:hypothetical protein